MSNESFESIWDAICDSPEEAAEWKRRSAILMVLREYTRVAGIPVGTIAKQLAVPVATVRAVMRGRINEISLEQLEGMARSAKANGIPLMI